MGPKGNLLLKILETGTITNVGNGGYFALDRLTFDTKTKSGTINSKNIEVNSLYKIAFPNFLLTGLESNLDYFNKKNNEILKITDATTESQKDVRVAVIN